MASGAVLETTRLSPPPGRAGRRPLARFIRKYPMGTVGAVLIVAMLLVGAFAEAVAPYDPVVNDFGAMFQRPSRAHWFGTDAFGRDVLSRILYGARTALLVGFGSSLLGATAGALLGVVSAYFGGRLDLWLQRLLDVVMAFPIIILAMAVVALLGTGTVNLVLAIALSFAPRAERVVRASALAVREMAYVEAARAVGAGPWRIIFRHMSPNVAAPYLVMLTAFLGQAILLEASLSFLGLGVAEPTPAWGLMLRGAAVDFVQRAPWMAIFPGLAISVAVLAFNVLGDALRDALDPRLRA
ncbi:MAG: ABC transporter permease [Armatimonadota bacterium]|nr:ABC transporter permease [Armatimonadota bacterium]MDR7427384.1 ABC transporter permease [Armatimonadota bacterium]MDR7464341.1 ABC transporter permease [Armatimonadota bacterium]MDR7474971.1 ABC transporter permease [Armatimonadota bacterium]MDR7537945.1 ABC transporter permease [Armatimonadota bacterium]